MRRISGIVILFLGIFAVPTFGAVRYAVFPQFVSGRGWSSELFFANQGLIEVTGITISFYDDSGASLPVESSLGTASSFTINLGAGATQVIKAPASATYREGYVVVKYPWTGSPVRATEVFRYEENGVVQVEVGLPQQEQGDHFSFPVEINKSEGILTAVNLANPMDFNQGGSVAETLVLNLIKPDGTLQGTTKVLLQPGQHLADYLDEAGYFPGLDNFIGTLSVSSPLGVAVMALRQDKQSFGAISTDGGPILGPFVVSGSQTLVEQEPNDTTDEALAISGSKIISGTIGTAGDVDAFKFTGRSGDIISVICDTQGTSSYLDSVLSVYDGNLNLVAYNDQNGLAPQLYPINDSFIQMVLPADGTYYIVVEDYYGTAGDSNYTYTLHVKLP